jgi:integrase
MVRIRDGRSRYRARPTMSTIKINENLRSALLRRPFKRSATRDADIAGLALIVTTRRAFWCLLYQPRGINPATGKRWGGGVRYELGDAMLVSVSEARGLALGTKAAVRQGRSPHHEAMASRASVEASRSILPITGAEGLDAYARALASRSTPSERSRAETLRYARKAVRLMKAEALPLSGIDARMIRLMVETMPGSQAERRHCFGGLDRFLTWCRKQGLVERNVCVDLDADDRPKPGKARNHVPTIATLRSIWAAVETEPVHVRDLIRFLLLVPLRRNEASELVWSEIDFNHQRLVISGGRMKNGEPHELPLSAPAISLLKGRQPAGARPSALVFPTAANKPHANWGAVIDRIRKAIGESETTKDLRFTFHDIRRGFVSHLAELFDVDALDQCLAHTRSGVRGVYQLSKRMDARAQALAAWAAILLDDAQPANVLQFARRADV